MTEDNCSPGRLSVHDVRILASLLQLLEQRKENSMTEGAKLLAHKGAVRVTRDELANYPAPEPTDTWKPVSHLQLVETLSHVMADRGLHITREQFAVQNAKLFGTFDTEWQKMEEYGAAVCFRHATDKSLAIQIGVGARVFICDNMSMHAELISVRKHTSKLNLGEEMDRCSGAKTSSRLRKNIASSQRTLRANSTAVALTFRVNRLTFPCEQLKNIRTSSHSVRMDYTLITSRLADDASSLSGIPAAKS